MVDCAVGYSMRASFMHSTAGGGIPTAAGSDMTTPFCPQHVGYESQAMCQADTLLHADAAALRPEPPLKYIILENQYTATRI